MCSFTVTTYAKYQSESDVVNNEVTVKEPKVKVTFDANWESGTTQSYDVAKGPLSKSLSSLPEVTRDTWTFEGWCTDTSYSTTVTLDTEITGECTFYAKWTKPGYALTGPEVLATFNQDAVYFKESLTEPVAQAVVYDISVDQDMSLLTWYSEEDHTQYWYNSARSMTLNADSSTIFQLPNAVEIDLTNISFEQVADATDMFKGAANVTEIDLTDAGLSTALRTSAGMFDGCTKLTDVLIGNFPGDYVQDMSRMFKDCSSLVNIGVDDWGTFDLLKKVESFMQGCSSLEKFNGLGLSILNCISFRYFADGCVNLKEVTWDRYFKPNLNTENNPDFEDNNSNISLYMFKDCSREVMPLMSFGAGGFNAEGTFIGKIPQVRFYFNISDDTASSFGGFRYYCNYREASGSLPSPGNWEGAEFVGWFDTPEFEGGAQLTLETRITEDVVYYARWKRPGYVATGKFVNSYLNKNMLSFVQANQVPDDSFVVYDISEMQDGSVLTWYDDTNFTQYWWSSTGRMVLNLNSTEFLKGCTVLSNINFDNIDFSRTRKIAYFFDDCKNITSVDLSDKAFGVLSDIQYLFSDCSSLQSFDLGDIDTSSVRYANGLFNDCAALRSVDLSDLDFGSVENLYMCFAGCTNLESIQLPSNLVNVRQAAYMFKACGKLTTVDLHNMSMQYVTNAGCMFKECASLETIDFSGHDWSSMLDVSELARGCTNLKSFKIPAELPKCTGMTYMLSECSALESIDLSYVNAPSVVNIKYMAYCCDELKELKLPQFGEGKLTDVSFLACDSKLEMIDLSYVDLSAVTDVTAMLDEDYYIREIYLGDNTLGSVTASIQMVDGVGKNNPPCTVYCTPEAQAVIEASELFTPANFVFVNPTSTASLQLYANGGIFDDGTSQMIITE